MLKIKNMTQALFASALLLSSAALLAQDWYLSPTGVDSGDCRNKEQPCKNIHPVVQKVDFVAGDRILLQKGTYDLQATTGGYGGPLDKAFEVYGGYNNKYDETKREKLPSKTKITDSRTSVSGNHRLFALKTGHALPVVFDGVEFADFTQDSTKTDRGLFTTHEAGAWLKFNNVLFTNNKLRSAGAVDLTVADDILEVNNASFETNQATNDVAGVIRLRANTRAFIRDVIFSGNTSSSNGGAIYVDNAKLTLTNATFFQNTAVTNGGAIYATGANAQVDCIHCSIVENSTNSVHLDSSAKFSLKNSLLIGLDANANLINAAFTDLGYNAFGLNETAKVAGANYTPAATSRKNSEANVTDLLVAEPDYFGGTIKSLKLSSINSSLIDKIPNDVPALQTGTSPTSPFTSLAQAHNALTSYSHYKKQKYFFDLSGKTFSTVVDKDGWILIASGDRFKAVGPYAETDNLFENTDEILDKTILAHTGFIFDEVRITTRNNLPVPIDIRSSNQNVINAVKGFKMLPNNHTSGAYGQGGWYALAGAKHILSGEPSGDNLTCATNSGTVEDLNKVIYHACGKANGIVWTPGANGHAEAHEWYPPAARTANFDLWVRSSAVSCGGVVNTDQRGLSRPDYVNPNDPTQYGDVRDCDIGSFEWNNGYHLDCYDEDGERPENSIYDTTITWCITDISHVTPKAIVDNMGNVTTPSIFSLLLLLLFRIRNSKVAPLH